MTDLTPELLADLRREAESWNMIGAERILPLLDALASHTCKSVWRPTTFEEIQPGWEVRARRYGGKEVTWGIAYHRDDDGDWLTKSYVLLTNDAAGWTYETTAPASEPKSDPRVDQLNGVRLREGVVLTRADAALILSIMEEGRP